MFPYAYAVPGLPNGLTFGPATRTISGTPTKTGSFTITYTADDADLKSAPRNPAQAAPEDTASESFGPFVTAAANDDAPVTRAVSRGNVTEGEFRQGPADARDDAAEQLAHALVRSRAGRSRSDWYVRHTVPNQNPFAPLTLSSRPAPTARTTG